MKLDDWKVRLWVDEYTFHNYHQVNAIAEEYFGEAVLHKVGGKLQYVITFSDADCSSNAELITYCGMFRLAVKTYKK